MGLYTKFIKLFKPDESEKYNINVFNENADLIDSALEQLDKKYENINLEEYTHKNKLVLDKLSESKNGDLLYDSKKIDLDNDHTHGFMKTITFSTTEPTSVSDGEIVMVYEE